MTEPQAVEVLGCVSELKDLVPLFKKRRISMKLNQRTVDDLAGIADGLTSKIEVGVRGIGVQSIEGIAGALKCRIALVSDDASKAKHKNNADKSDDCNDELKKVYAARSKKSAAVTKVRKGDAWLRARARKAAKTRWRNWRELKRMKAERERRNKRKAEAESTPAQD